MQSQMGLEAIEFESLENLSQQRNDNNVYEHFLTFFAQVLLLRRRPTHRAVKLGIHFHVQSNLIVDELIQ